MTIPNLRIVVGACLIAVLGYTIFSGWAVFYSDDAALRGDVIGTWKSFAVAAFTFWIGSSSGGKSKTDPEPGTTTTTTTVQPAPAATVAPTPVVVVNPPDAPAQVEQVGEPPAEGEVR